MSMKSNLEKVKDCGWYWGPITRKTAEKILLKEPEGSFVVRDSSDDHYLFSLSFNLCGVTKHVRIAYDKGTFSFGGLSNFKSQDIVDFIESAVNYSQSGGYNFFELRPPQLGPQRIQLLHPVSRFKRVQSLKQLCRVVIMNHLTSRDMVSQLPLPQLLKDYLNTKNFYIENFEDD